MGTGPEQHLPDDVPADLAAALQSIFATAAAGPDVERLLALFDGALDFERDDATVAFDADGDPALVGVRAAGLLDERQIVAESGGVTVVLDVRRSPDHDGSAGPDDGEIGIRGEILGGDDDVYSVQLLVAGEEVALTVTDEFGEFRMDHLAPGSYELVIAGARREIVLAVVLD